MGAPRVTLVLTERLARIIGVTHPGKLASQHVLAKVGMRDEGWGRYYDRELRLFAIDRASRDAGAGR